MAASSSEASSSSTQGGEKGDLLKDLGRAEIGMHIQWGIDRYKEDNKRDHLPKQGEVAQIMKLITALKRVGVPSVVTTTIGDDIREGRGYYGISRYLEYYLSRDEELDAEIGRKLMQVLGGEDEEDWHWPETQQEWDQFREAMLAEGLPPYLVTQIIDFDAGPNPTFNFFVAQARQLEMSGGDAEIRLAAARKWLADFYADDGSGPEVEELEAQRTAAAVDQLGYIPDAGNVRRWRILCRLLYHNGIPFVINKKIEQEGEKGTGHPLLSVLLERAGRTERTFGPAPPPSVHYSAITRQGMSAADLQATAEIIRDVTLEFRREGGTGFLPDIGDQTGWRNYVQELDRFFVDKDLVRYIFRDAADEDGQIFLLDWYLEQTGTPMEYELRSAGAGGGGGGELGTPAGGNVNRDYYEDILPQLGIRRFFLRSIAQIRSAYADDILDEAQYLEALRQYEAGEEQLDLPLRRRR